MFVQNQIHRPLDLLDYSSVRSSNVEPLECFVFPFERDVVVFLTFLVLVLF